MKLLKFVCIFCVALLLSFCKKNTSDNIDCIKKKSLKLDITDTLIKGIDSSKILDLKSNKAKVIKLFFNSFQKDYNKPLINFDQVRNNVEKIEVKKYSDFIINGRRFESFLLSFPYENDELYKSILLTNNLLDDGLIIYEKVLDEGEYLRTSKISKSIIINSIFKIEYFTYDKEGNISGELAKKDSSQLLTNSYLVQKTYFLEYFKKTKSNINREWGDKEIIYTNDRLDSSLVSLYQMKGKVNNNVKTGNWEERRYILDYGKSVWLNGQYINGLRNGEWNFSPEGPVDKIEVYNMGKLVKTYFP